MNRHAQPKVCGGCDALIHPREDHAYHARLETYFHLRCSENVKGEDVRRHAVELYLNDWNWERHDA